MTSRRNSEIFTLAEFVKRQAETRALDCIHEAVFLIDENAMIVYVNDEACRQLGYSRGELLSMNIEDLHPNWLMEKWTKEYWKALEKDKSIALDVKLKKKDGAFFFTEIVTSSHERDGANYTLVICRDAAREKETLDHRSINHANYHALLDN
jgi:PAS domain S-box-containing protein